MSLYRDLAILWANSASCNWWQPPPVQVEGLHQLKEWKHHKHQVQRSGCKGKGQDTQCKGQGQHQCNYMQLQPCRYHQHSTMRQSVLVQLAWGPTIHPTHLACISCDLPRWSYGILCWVLGQWNQAVDIALTLKGIRCDLVLIPCISTSVQVSLLW